MKIEKITKWRTSDGVEHSTQEMAEQYLLNDELLGCLARNDRTWDQAQDLLNDLSNYRKELRAWLDACDAMEKASFQ
jgi:hypothetical protein